MAAVIPILAVVASVASTGYSVYSSSQASSAQSKANREQRALYATQMEQSKEANAQKASDYEKRARAALSTERSQRGTSGISMAGSPLLTYWENAKTFEEDVSRIKRTGELEQTALAQRGALNETYAKAGEEVSKLQTGQTLLTGASNIFSQGQKVGWW